MSLPDKIDFSLETKATSEESDKMFKLIKQGDCNKLKKCLDMYKHILINSYRDIYDNTLLHAAIRYKNKEIMIILLQMGANMDEKNDQGTTPLDFMVHSQELICAYVEYLKKPHVDRAEKNEEEIKIYKKNLSNIMSHLKKINAEYTSEKQKLNDNNKRLRDEYEELENANKKLRKENDRLEIENKNLKKDVRNYIGLFKNRK